MEGKEKKRNEKKTQKRGESERKMGKD